MDSIRLFLLATSILSAMLGGLYATSRGEAAAPSEAVTPEEVGEPALVVLDGRSDLAEHALPAGIDVPPEAPEDLTADVFSDPFTGVTLGPLALRRASEEPEVAPEIEATRSASVRTSARRAPTPRREPVPRLDADPGRHVLLTARGMMARGETVRGSCYAYLSEVFDRAGHDGWRTRSVIHDHGPTGPYADLDRIRPGDWLYIVNNPDSTPMGTHSVLFVGWEDRSQGYARTISHPGWAAGAHTGRESTYDISRTYRIIRPRMAAQ